MIRLLDIFFSGFGLLLGWPVLLIIALIGWFDNGSPLFMQVRVGRFQVPFTLVKFRSMRPREFDNLDPIDEFRAMGREDLAIQFEKGNFKLDNDPRITKFGSFLRNSSLDELPQILKNDYYKEYNLYKVIPFQFMNRSLAIIYYPDNAYGLLYQTSYCQSQQC